MAKEFWATLFENHQKYLNSIFEFCHFFTNFQPIKIGLSGNTVWQQATVTLHCEMRPFFRFSKTVCLSYLAKYLTGSNIAFFLLKALRAIWSICPFDLFHDLALIEILAKNFSTDKKLLHSFSSRNRLKIVYSSNQSLKETWLFHNCYHDEQNFGDEVQNWIICFVLLVKLDDLNEWKVFIVKAKQQKVCTCRFSSLGHKKVQKYLSSLPLSTSQKHSVLFQTFRLKISFHFTQQFQKSTFSKIKFLYNLS